MLKYHYQHTIMEDRMPKAGKIRIISTPPGEAPEWVRKAWIGLELPVYAKSTKDFPTIGVVTGTIEEPYDGYSVVFENGM